MKYFIAVQGDDARHLDPDSRINLNSTGAWVVGPRDDGSRLKTQKTADLLNELLDKVVDYHFEDCHYVADRIYHDHYCPTCPGCTCGVETLRKELLLEERRRME